MLEQRNPTGWYLYGLLDIHPPAETFSGLNHVCCLRFRQASALVSEVGLDEFDEEKLKERMKDPEWLERKLWAHEEVLDRALGIATVIPMKFATILTSQRRLLSALEEHYEGLLELFKRLKGKHEYGFKVFWDRRVAQEQLEQTHGRAQVLKEQLKGQPQGTAYLMRKQLDKLIAEELDKRLNQDLQAIDERLGGIVDERRLNMVTAEQTIKPEAETVLNAAVLISCERKEELLAAASGLKVAMGPFGYSFKIVGPFPPYHFSWLPGLSSERG